MARNAKQIRNLKKLIDRADLLARTATREWRKTIVEIRKEIAYMTNEVRNIGGNADAREAILRNLLNILVSTGQVPSAAHNTLRRNCIGITLIGRDGF